MHPLFSKLTLFLETTVSPISNDLDSNSTLLKNCYQQLIELDGLRLRIPCEYGGLGFERYEWIEYTSQLAGYSGALLFLQAQHQYAISRLNKLLPDPKIASVLQSLAKKNIGVGVGFASNKKILTVEKCADGFYISGMLKWVTGFDFFPHILLSFDKDDIDYYCFLPFEAISHSLILSPILEPIVFSATNTVSITLKNYFIPFEKIIISHISKPKVPFEHPAIYSLLGATKALLKIAATEKYHYNSLVKDRLKVLSEEWKTYHTEVMQSAATDPFRLRAAGLELAEKCLSFAKLVCDTQGLLKTHAITRINREIWQYSIGGYSEGQLEAYLKHT